MRKTAGVTAVLILTVAMTATAQLRSQVESKPNVTEAMVRPDASGLMFGFINPNNFSMRHSFSLSYSTFGGHSMSLGMYTNSMFYRIADPLDLQVDVSMIHSPFSSFGDQFSRDLSGVYLTRAELNYRPSDNTLVQFQFRQLPSLYWMNDMYRSPFYGSSRTIPGDH
ncbi:MAG: hypothetical protein WD295_02725 [Bacteroidota bacterium]